MEILDPPSLHHRPAEHGRALKMTHYTLHANSSMETSHDATPSSVPCDDRCACEGLNSLVGPVRHLFLICDTTTSRHCTGYKRASVTAVLHAHDSTVHQDALLSLSPEHEGLLLQ